MDLIYFLILFPLAAAVAIAVAPSAMRGFLVTVSAVVTAGASLLLLGHPGSSGQVVLAVGPAADKVLLPIELAITALLVIACFRYRRFLALLPLAAQSALTLWAESGHHAPAHEPTILVDPLAVIMALIIGVVGGLIAIHAVAYMSDYHHHHPERKDDQRGFFVVFFLFLSAMFGVVFSNSLNWLFAFWEITTLCSFLMISYPRTEEAMNNAFRALTLNLIGGVGFAGAIAWVAKNGGSMDITGLIGGGAAALIPVLLICFAGAAKSAQFPFSSWLLGAMVAPTPVSALLHSSTMVKAGVYVVIRLAPVLAGTLAGSLLSLVGGVTFCMASVVAVTQSNAKRVLAYSTIANLGLIVACAATGHPQAVWAAILLVIFHAVAKALLFLAVGTVEHQIGSRDIEDMRGLIARAPALTILILIGIAGMFLAPFGMLISKWAALEALVNVNPLLAILVCFGSAATLFFWAKWMGHLLAADMDKPEKQLAVPFDERTALLSLAVLTVGLCGLFPLVSSRFLDPYLLFTYHEASHLDGASLLLVGLMLATMAMLPLGLLYKGGVKMRRVTPYLSGANVVNRAQFTGSMGMTRTTEMRNYYLAQMFGEKKMSTIALWATVALLAAMFLAGAR